MEKDALKSFGHVLRLGKYNRLNRELSDVVRYISVFFYLSKHSTKHSDSGKNYKKHYACQVVSERNLKSFPSMDL